MDGRSLAGASRSSRRRFGSSVRRLQPMCHPCQAGDHHAEGPPARTTHPWPGGRHRRILNPLAPRPPAEKNEVDTSHSNSYVVRCRFWTKYGVLFCNPSSCRSSYPVPFSMDQKEGCVATLARTCVVHFFVTYVSGFPKFGED